MLQYCSYLLSFDATPTLHYFLFHSVLENIGPHNECIQTFSHSYTKRTNRTQSNTTDSFPFLFIQTFSDDYRILTKPTFTCLSIMHTHIYVRLLTIQCQNRLLFLSIEQKPMQSTRCQYRFTEILGNSSFVFQYIFMIYSIEIISTFYIY